MNRFILSVALFEPLRGKPIISTLILLVGTFLIAIGIEYNKPLEMDYSMKDFTINFSLVFGMIVGFNLIIWVIKEWV